MNKLFCFFLAIGLTLVFLSAMENRVNGTTPKQDGFRMPGEFEKQEKIWKLTMTQKPVYLQGVETIDYTDNAAPNKNGALCDASYMNLLIVNSGVIVPLSGDEYDALVLKQIQEVFPDCKIVGINTLEVIYCVGNIHCITQHQMTLTR